MAIELRCSTESFNTEPNYYHCRVSNTDTQWSCSTNDPFPLLVGDPDLSAAQLRAQTCELLLNTQTDHLYEATDDGGDNYNGTAFQVKQYNWPTRLVSWESGFMSLIPRFIVNERDIGKWVHFNSWFGNNKNDAEKFAAEANRISGMNFVVRLYKSHWFCPNEYVVSLPNEQIAVRK